MLDEENCKDETTEMDDCEDMEDDTNQNELGEIAVVVPPKPSNNLESQDPKKKKQPASSEEALSTIVSEGSNIQANKQIKKRRKRANKLSDALGGTLESAMTLTTGDSEAMATEEDNVKDAASFFV